MYEDEKTVKYVLDKIQVNFAKYLDDTEKEKLNQNDVMLITYGDSITSKGKNGLDVLNNFMQKYVGNAINTIHLLPMFPFTSDDGFSVVDYREINPDLGDWGDIERISENYSMMFDAVINHASAHSDWFKRYLNCEKPYSDYFITADPDEDYSAVTRPRALPLLTKVQTVEGEKFVWTTFSDDQIDLNFKNPDLLIEILDILLDYSKRGAKFIRLDAIGFMWKEKGTSCIHLPQAHAGVKLMRAVLEKYQPNTYIITETNVPHKDNISYFGNGYDEAHLVYQFPLPPLTMFTLLTGNSDRISNWLDSLEDLSEENAFFNFLSSHDGIGVRPTEGILSKDEQQILFDATLRNGGNISYKDNGDGTQSPYELNINYQDALASPEESDENRIAKFIAAQALLISLKGVPGIYVHSLLGSRNDYFGQKTSNINRRINREKLDYDFICENLDKPSNRQIIFNSIIKLLNIRKSHEEFSPDATQKVLFLDKKVFAVERIKDNKKIVVLINISNETLALDANFKGVNLITENYVNDKISLKPYEIMWIKCEEN